MTKVILNQTVVKLGVAGDIVDVKPGFARNYLLPQNYAILWTKRAETQVELRKAARLRKAVEDIETAQEVKTELEAEVLNVPAKAGSTGKLFGAITGADIANAAKTTLKVTIDKRKVLMDAPIKKLGSDTVKVHILDDIDAVVKINVISAGK